MINWQYYPKSDQAPQFVIDLVRVFENNAASITSPDTGKGLESNQVLAALRNDLKVLGYRVEEGKKKSQKIKIPVLFGRNGRLEKSFDADAVHDRNMIVLEVEAGRGYLNNQFLKDLFQACMMQDIEYFAIAVRNLYLGKSQDFEEVISFFDSLYASGRLKLPLKGVLVIGY